MDTLTALIITQNAAEVLDDCLASVRWADEIVVVDSGSTDDTCSVARQYTNKVIFHSWSGHAAQKNFGQTLVTGDWTLSIDADERVTPELQSEIRFILDRTVAGYLYDAYRIPIRDWMFGKFVHYGSWPHQAHIRLYRSGRVTWAGSVHEGAQVQGQTGQLSNPLLHYSHTSLGRFIDKLNKYTDIEAQEMFAQGTHIGLTRTLFGAARAFLGQYVRLQGFRDGGHGFILASLMAFYYFAARAKLWSLWYMHQHPHRR
jgi:glycosyltransferase involved in cell wall biosynthesis